MTAAIPFIIDTAVDAAAAEGAGEVAESGIADDISGELDLGHGHKMHFSNEQFREVLHSESVVEGISNIASRVTDICNSTKVKKRAIYEFIVQNSSDSTRARAFVRPANADAFYDDAVNSTMLKAAAQVPSDPKPTGESSGDSSNAVDDSAEVEGEAAEAAEGAELADIAEIAIVAL